MSDRELGELHEHNDAAAPADPVSGMEPPTCAYCHIAPAWLLPLDPPQYTDPPLCHDCRLWRVQERREALLEGRRRFRHDRAAAAEYRRLEQAVRAIDAGAGENEHVFTDAGAVADQPQGVGSALEPVPPHERAALERQRAWIEANPELWEARQEASRLGERLMEESRRRGMAEASAELGAALYEAEVTRLRRPAASGYSLGADRVIVRTEDGEVLPWSVGADGGVVDEAGRSLPLVVTAAGTIVFDPSRLATSHDGRGSVHGHERDHLIERLTFANAELRRMYGHERYAKVSQGVLARAVGYSRQHLSLLASPRNLDIDLSEYQRVKGPPLRNV